MSKHRLETIASDSLKYHRVFEYEGHSYVLVSNEYDKKTRYTNLTVNTGCLACFNIHSKTIRGIHRSACVELTDVKLGSEKRAGRVPLKKKAPSKVTNRLMDPKEIELRSDSANHLALDRVQRAISNYLSEQRDPGDEWSEYGSGVPAGDRPKRGCVTVDTDLPQAVQDYLQSKGFACSPVMETVPNDTFYPPTKTQLRGYEISWLGSATFYGSPLF